MNKNSWIVLFVILFGAFASLSACTGPGSGNQPPTADAGENREVPAGDPVILSASNSSDPDGDSLAYAWRIALQPEGSIATLSDSHTVTTTLEPDALGLFVVELTVSDGPTKATTSVDIEVIEGLEFSRDEGEQYDPFRTGTVVEGEIILPGASESSRVLFEEIDGIGVFQGDIILGPVDALANGASSQGTAMGGGLGHLWPGGIVPYVIDESVRDKSWILPKDRPGQILSVIDYWEEKTRIRFVPRTTEENYVVFVGSSGCSSYVGMQGGRQEIGLSTACSVSTIVHEIGHAIGLWHEHTHPERDEHVRILEENIQEGKKFNFDIPENAVGLGPYDYASVMHYGARAFTKNGRPTIETIPPGIPIGRHNAGLSAGDTYTIDLLYAPLTEFSGFVRDAITGAPVEGANVTWGGNVASTDSNGEYYFRALSCQGSNFLVTHLDYQTHHEFYTHSCMQLNQKDFHLQPSSPNEDPQAPGSLTLNAPTPYCTADLQPAIRLTWSASVGAEAYEIHRDGSLYAELQTLETTYENTANVTPGQAYTYIVRASNSVGVTNSNSRTITVPTDVCASEPTEFTLHPAEPFCTWDLEPAVRLRWEPAPGVEMYEIHRNGSLYFSLETLGTTFENTANVSAGATYAYFVRAHGAVGLTDSNQVIVTAPASCGGQLPGPITGRTIAAGGSHSLAIADDGTAWAWGVNASGELGDGTFEPSFTPIRVSGLSSVVALAAGNSYSLALSADGRAWAWGYNADGQLGDGTRTDSGVPLRQSDLTEVSSIAAGGNFALAALENGSVWGWGENEYGQLGTGTTHDSLRPVQVDTVRNIAGVSAGLHHALALRIDGTVWAWGNNGHGQLGDGSLLESLTPLQVVGLENVVSVSAGLVHSLALHANGTVWAWGNNTAGQLGDGTMQDRLTPVQVPGLTDIVAIASGFSHSVALRGDGTVWAWGDNQSGTVGDGTTTTRARPVQVQGLSNISQIASNGSHSLALRRDGAIWAWGWGGNGQLGDGSGEDHLTPVLVADFQ